METHLGNIHNLGIWFQSTDLFIGEKKKNKVLHNFVYYEKLEAQWLVTLYYNIYVPDVYSGLAVGGGDPEFWKSFHSFSTFQKCWNFAPLPLNSLLYVKYNNELKIPWITLVFMCVRLGAN